MAKTWNWKNKDGGKGGLLYESGNWGDMLKMLWLRQVLEWKNNLAGNTNYFDPFAGDVQYDLGKKAAFRLNQTGLDQLDFLRKPFTGQGKWPSAASGARLLAGGKIEVWDADAGRRENWRAESGVAVPDGESGWELLRRHDADSHGVWMVDPYDFLAEWRETLPLIAVKSRATTLLLYVYNRSARNEEHFREYRACKNALDDLRGDLPKRVGRAASDVFLPRSHHEMWFLPAEADCDAPGFDTLLEALAASAAGLERGMRRCGVCDA